jgi:hypothetical protein
MVLEMFSGEIGRAEDLGEAIELLRLITLDAR